MSVCPFFAALGVSGWLVFIEHRRRILRSHLRALPSSCSSSSWRWARTTDPRHGPHRGKGTRRPDPARPSTLRRRAGRGRRSPRPGLVLAGSFAVLALHQQDQARGNQIEAIGFGLAIGILLDTFIVRVLLVPATVALLQGAGTGGPAPRAPSRLAPRLLRARRPRRSGGPEAPPCNRSGPRTRRPSGAAWELVSAALRDTPSATRRRGRSGSTFPPATTPRGAVTPSSTSCRDSAVSSPVGAPPDARAHHARAHRRRLRRGGSAVPRRLRRRLDAARGQPVPRLAGDRPVPHLPVRGRRSACPRRVPHDSPGAPPPARRPLERRLRGGRHGNAAAGCVLVLRLARRRLPVRAVAAARHRPRLPGLRDHYDGSYDRFLAELDTRPAMSEPTTSRS